MTTIFSDDIPATVLAALKNSPLVACDTETSGLDWLTDRLELCQIFAPTYGTLLLRVGDTRPTNLIGLIQDPRIKKVFHHAPFDLAFMRRAWQVEPRNIVCTKIASKLVAGNRAQEHSLQSLLESRLGINLRKGAARTSDWGAVLLAPEQVEYAAGDVKHLIPLYESLLTDIKAGDLQDLYNQCCEFLTTRCKLDQLGLGDIFSY
ncbi:ribonuclease D [Pseudarthrobacter oxydans]|uniref:Ribonuclease D n=1 Tax=Pseudarthrobacter oxydans TaxID=1671 RepID=A0AAW8NCL7_PSEOX|nr:hypothetical protein [Pseudarthrobacter oxydans]MDR6793050.1 ribonuclease D [Pseudarthrobacter oxydans]MDR7163937.1 ribonuclease D [Pseudarthrobacter oxydans]